MVLINSLGIQDSGGITVFKKVLNEFQNTNYNYLIICNKNQNIEKLVVEFVDCTNFEFILIESNGSQSR